MSTYLLWITAAISLISGILTLTMVGRLSDVYADLYEGTAAAGTESIVVGSSVFAVVLNILFAAGLVILAIFNNRGRQGSRITTWVLGGLMLCCSGGGLAGTAITSSINVDSAGGPTQEEIQSRLDSVLPAWYQPLSVVLTVGSLLAILGAVILLALPASNAFFRRPAAGGFDPSVPYPAQPGGQPPYPGGPSPYPTYPQGQPSYPPPSQGGQPGYPPASQGGQPGYPPAYPQSGPPAGYPQSGPPAGPPQSGPPQSGPPSYPPQQEQPPATPPSSDPWGKPEGGEQKPPTDPTSQP